VILAVAAGVGWYRFGDSGGSAAAAAKPGPPPQVPVTADVVGTQDVPVYVVGVGSVQAYNTVTVRSRIDGQVTQVLFTEGQEVKTGDRLFQIDPRSYQAALDQALATKQKDEAQLASAQADLARYEKLIGSGFQSRQSYDQQKAQVAQLQAALRGDDATIETAKVNLGYADIRSPIDGRTGARLVDLGNIVHASDTTGLVTITQIKPIFATFTVPQDQLDAIRRGQSQAPLAVKVFSESDKDLLAEGKLSLIDNQVDQATGTVRLKAVFDNADERLWPGEFINARLVTAVRRNAVTVPARAVLQGANGYYAYVIKPDDTAERRDVQVAATQDGIAVIEKGLSPGEKIVVDGQYRLTDGAKVKVAAPETAAR
jgi:multidrug efflux system membrane fusion protein